ncbi:queuosine precursor transporter [Dongshaea marina]|uniref:queuosine precursor transporter n=1 Tax=Dongshaea marina TaxID=2047966 RepID=UPI001F219F96|nr:queuosine precursor transporter [Dongshaea marina]
MAVYSYSRTIFIPILFVAYTLAILTACFADASTFDGFGFPTPLSWLVFPLTFVFEDCLTELYGRNRSLRIIFKSCIILLISSALLKLFFLISSNSPEYAHSLDLNKMAYLPFDIAYSAIDALIASVVDIIVFSHIYKSFRNYGFWFRATLSSLTSQFCAAIIAGLYFYVVVNSTAPFDEIYNNAMLYFLWGFGLSIAYIPISYAILLSVKTLAVSPKYREFAWKSGCLCIVNILAIFALVFSGASLNLFELHISLSALLLSALCALTLAYLRDSAYIHTLAIVSVLGVITTCIIHQQLSGDVIEDILITALSLGCIWMLGYLEEAWVQLPGVIFILALNIVTPELTPLSFLITLLLQGAITWLLVDNALTRILLLRHPSWVIGSASLTIGSLAGITYAIGSPLLAQTGLTLPSLWLSGVVLITASAYLMRIWHKYRNQNLSYPESIGLNSY